MSLFKRYIYFLNILCIFGLVNINVLNAQTHSDTEIKSALIMNFTKYLAHNQWDELKVCLIGYYGADSASATALNNINGKRIKGRKIYTKQLEKVDALPQVDILYVLKENEYEISRIYKLIKGSNILLITDRHQEKREVMINFYHTENNQVKFELNSKNIQDQGFTILPDLLLIGGTDLDIRELYKVTEKNLQSEKEKVEQTEKKLAEKQLEVDKLIWRISLLYRKTDSLDGVVQQKSNDIIQQQAKLSNLENNITLLTDTLLKQQRALDSTNKYIKNRNYTIYNLDKQLNKKQLVLESAADTLEYLQKSISEKEHRLNRQLIKINNQKKTNAISIAFLLLLLVFFISTFKSNKIKQAKNNELERRNKQIEQQNKQITQQAEELFHTNLELEKLSVVAEKTDNAIIIMDEKGDIEWVNNGFVQMLGYNLKDFKKAKGYNFINASSHENAEQILHTCLKLKEAFSYISSFKRPDGKEIWLNTTITPVLNNKNEIEKIVAIDSDITQIKEAEREIRFKNMEIEENSEILRIQANELKKTNKQLEQQKNETEMAYQQLKEAQSQLVSAEKMASLGQLTAGIAHEINNPVSYISSSIEGLKTLLDDIKDLLNDYELLVEKNNKEATVILKEKYGYNDLINGFEELTTNIKMGVDRTKEIVNGLRTFSRVDEANFSVQNIGNIIHSAIVLIGKQYKDRIQIHANTNNMPKIECLPGKVSQLFVNIIVNAIQAIEGKGDIFIKSRLYETDENEFLCIEIKDTGKGMTDETRKKIFEPFYTTKDVGEGTGLGLSIAYSIIKKHNGFVEVESSLNIGTNFKIFLPLKQT